MASKRLPQAKVEGARKVECASWVKRSPYKKGIPLLRFLYPGHSSVCATECMIWNAFLKQNATRSPQTTPQLLHEEGRREGSVPRKLPDHASPLQGSRPLVADNPREGVLGAPQGGR